MPIRFSLALRAAAACACLLGMATAFAATSGDPTTPESTPTRAATRDPDDFFQSIVKVQTRAVPDARTAKTLGREREGTGIVIGSDGLIVTIGYLIVEADDVTIVDAQGRSLPGRVVGYDQATGLGLVRSVVPLSAPPLPLGDSAKLSPHEPVLIVNHEGIADVTLARVVSQRPFAGNWEYLLDEAIFTSPPNAHWSGAALVNRELELVGVGSLIVRDATTDEPNMPGNMFVPIDALKPILDDLVRIGHRAGPPRPWLGISADEVQGRLVVAGVSPDGPADQAGVQPGDIILGVGGDGVRTQAEFYRKVWKRGSAGVDVPLRVLQGIDVHELTVHSIDRFDYFKPRSVY